MNSALHGSAARGPDRSASLGERGGWSDSPLPTLLRARGPGGQNEHGCHCFSLDAGCTLLQRDPNGWAYNFFTHVPATNRGMQIVEQYK